MSRTKAKVSKRKVALPRPSQDVLIKLGCIAVHAEEFLAPGGHQVDRYEIEKLLVDPELKAWIKAMGVLLPLKRSDR